MAVTLKSPPDRQLMAVDGLTLEYRDLPARHRNRPTLVLLHEGLGCLALWRHFPDDLATATGCRTVAWSRAGYGNSDAYPQCRTDDYLHHEAYTALPPVLAALHIERPLLIGHSDGASIALLFAARFPEQTAGVVAMAPHEFVEEETLAGIRSTVQAWRETDLPKRLARYHRQPERVFREWSETWLSPSFRHWNITDVLSSIRCPVLALQGENDPYATLRQIEVIAERVPETHLLCLPHCGHAPHQDQTAAVLRILTEWINARDPEAWHPHS